MSKLASLALLMDHILYYAEVTEYEYTPYKE